MSMIPRTLGLVLLAGAALVFIEGVSPQDSKAVKQVDKKIGDKAIRHAGQVFMKSCFSCHVIPDPTVLTDRSWLDQVKRTA